MKSLLSIFILFSGFLLDAQTLNQVRESFHSVVVDPEESRAFHKLVGESEMNNPTLLAYRAVSEAMLAQVQWNPLNKLSQVSKYSRMMSEVVEDNPDHIEIRFLRLAVEYNLPRFLSMSEHIEMDRQFILSNLSQVSALNLDPKFGAYIFSFMRQAELITDEQLTQVEDRLLTLHQ